MTLHEVREKAKDQAENQHKIYEATGKGSVCGYTHLDCNDKDCRGCLTPIAVTLQEILEQLGGGD